MRKTYARGNEKGTESVSRRNSPFHEGDKGGDFVLGPAGQELAHHQELEISDGVDHRIAFFGQFHDGAPGVALADRTLGKAAADHVADQTRSARGVDAQTFGHGRDHGLFLAGILAELVDRPANGEQNIQLRKIEIRIKVQRPECADPEVTPMEPATPALDHCIDLERGGCDPAFDSCSGQELGDFIVSLANMPSLLFGRITARFLGLIITCY